jgi:dynein heavy chain
MIKSYTSPPPAAEITLRCVLILLKSDKTDWVTCKQYLTDMKFLDKLRNYDVDNVPDKIIKKAKPIIDSDAFDPEEIGRKVGPCRSLAKWCSAVVSYT